MDTLFAERVKGVPRSFIREILRASLDPNVISFAGGLPNPDFFPAEQLERATKEVFEQAGREALQYSNSEGDLELRTWIAKRYLDKQGLTVSPANIIITNGSQQGLDLLARVFLDKNDPVLIEEPGYLGAIQSLSMYQPLFQPVGVGPDGMDVSLLEAICSRCKPKMMYSVPNFQNPSGITYSDSVRAEIGEIARRYGFLLIEDDPYGDLRFTGKAQKSLCCFLPEQTVMLGSFSKIVAPGLRLGWIAAPEWAAEKLLIAKQAADLHTQNFGQKVLVSYLSNNDLDHHISKIAEIYGAQCRTMMEAIERYFPPGINFTRPEGGMFLWAHLSTGKDSRMLFEEAVIEKVVFVPGDTFYTHGGGENGFRLNFSCVSPGIIEEGIQRLSRALDRIL